MDLTPRDYATSLRALTLAECNRLGGGGLTGFVTWVVGKFLPPQGKMRLPIPFAEIEADERDLSDVLRHRFEQLLPEFERAGYRRVGCQILPAQDGVIDSGGVILLSRDGRTAASVNLLAKAEEAAPADEPAAPGAQAERPAVDFTYVEVRSLTRYLPAGYLSVGDDPTYLNPAPGSRVASVPKGSPLAHLERVLDTLSRPHAARLLTFSDWPTLRAKMEEGENRNFLHRRDVRRLFVAIEDPAEATTR